MSSNMNIHYVALSSLTVQVTIERALRHAVQERLPIVVVIDKVHRVITELELPPQGAYFKLGHTLEVINDLISSASTSAGGIQTVDPTAGNVCFAGESAGWSLQSFAKLYVKLHGILFDSNKFASMSMGRSILSSRHSDLQEETPRGGVERSFRGYLYVSST